MSPLLISYIGLNILFFFAVTAVTFRRRKRRLQRLNALRGSRSAGGGKGDPDDKTGSDRFTTSFPNQQRGDRRIPRACRH